MNKTVKELANELNVSKQTIHRTIQKRNIETIQDGNKILLDDTAQKAVIKEIALKAVQNGTVQDVPTDDINKTQNNTERSTNNTERSTNITADSVQTDYIESLKANIDLLSQQLAIKDKQIESLIEQNTIITTALQASQALHAGTIHQQAIETKAEEPESQPASSEPQEQPEPKRSFFKRLFGKK